MKHVVATAGLLMLCLLTGPALAQGVYKWVTADGVTHYSDQPPVSGNAEEMPIRYRRTDRGSMQARLQDDANLRAAAATREADEAEEAEDEEAAREQVLSERAGICQQARERLSNYENARRLYKPGPDGERIYLTDDELDAERAAARQAIQEWCDG